MASGVGAILGDPATDGVIGMGDADRNVLADQGEPA